MINPIVIPIKKYGVIPCNKITKPSVWNEYTMHITTCLKVTKIKGVKKYNFGFINKKIIIENIPKIIGYIYVINISSISDLPICQ